MTTKTLDRRDFLKVGSVAGAGLLIGFTLPGRIARAGTNGAALASADFQPNAFLLVEPSGAVKIWVGRSDMGQGVRTALPMIVADELEVEWDSVEVVQAPGDPEKYGRQMTVGSTSVRGGAWMSLRRAGATGREMLVAAAAATWGVSVAECRAERGRVAHPASGRSLGYGELAERASEMPVPEEPRLKDPSEFRLIGTRVPLRDLDDKVTGRAVYGLDVRLPGMLFATVVHPPMVGGSVGRIDSTGALQVEGVRHVTEISRGVAVVAENTWAAFEGADALEVEWNPGELTMGSDEIFASFRALAENPGAVALEEGDTDAALASAARTVEAEYTLPYLAHATMEPMNCTAHVRSDSCEVWAPTQNPQGAQQTAARLTGLPIESVTAHVTFMGCGWGRRSSQDFVEEAVETSKAVGAPVQVVWSREEDMRNDYYRPAYFARFRGGVDAQGRVSALWARVVAPPIGGRRGRGVDRNAVDGIANTMYSPANVRIENHSSDVPVPTGYWRSVGPSAGTFLVESFLDELAHAAGRDPYEVRVELLAGHERGTRMIQRLAEVSGWGSPLPAGRARGMAIGQDKGSVVGQVAEVSVDGRQVRVHRVVCVVDCGRAIHPGIVEQQMAGSIIAGLSQAFHNEITLDQGRVVQGNFNTYDMVRMDEAPEIEVHIIDTDEAPGSAGEPGVPPAAPAVANALLALTGQPVRSLPVRL